MKAKKPLIFIIEDYGKECRRVQTLFETKGYETKGFATRKEAFHGMQKASRKGRLPSAVVTDILTKKDDMKLQDFLDQMNQFFSKIPLYISSVRPQLLRVDDIIMPFNTLGAFHRTSGMDELLENLAQVLARKEPGATR